MEEEFELPVFFKDADLRFPAKLLNYGYSYKLQVEIEGTLVLFEPDEERNWRALLSYEDIINNKKVSVELIKAVAFSIEQMMKDHK